VTVSRNVTSSNTEMEKLPSERSFGLLFSALFFIIATYPWLYGMQVRKWVLVPSIVFLALSLIRPKLLRPLNRIWYRFSIIISKFMNPVVMTLLFITVFIPAGLMLRIFKKDSLRLKFNKEDLSYWIQRVPPGPPPESMSNQF